MAGLTLVSKRSQSFLQILGLSLRGLPGPDLLNLAANGLLHLGLTAFIACEQAARRQGLLAYY